MPRKQDRYAQAPKKTAINGRNVMVAADSDLTSEVIEEIVQHQAALRERLGDEHTIGWRPRNGALRTALRAEGLTN